MYKNKKKNKTNFYKKNNSDNSSFLSKLHKILSHRLYFMFIPHSKKKTKTLSIPIYGLLIIVLIIAAALLITFSSLTKNTVIASKTLVLTGSYQERLEEINSLENLFNSVFSNDSYREDMSNMMNKFKIENTNLINTNNIDNIALLNARAKEFENLKNYLEELKANINSKNTSLEYVPTITPIDSRYAVISKPYQKDSLLSKGIGFQTIAGTLVRATASGTINSVVYDKDEGVSIVIYHRYGIITTYKGLATTSVKTNVDVKKGDIIGNAKTGELEYELKLASEYVNPLIFTTLNYEQQK